MKSTLTLAADDLSPSAWDAILAELGGHPLQSALWGQARHAVDGISETRCVLRYDGDVVGLARVEVRRVLGLGSVAWIPRGPTWRPGLDWNILADALRDHLQQQGFILVAMAPWRAASGADSVPLSSAELQCDRTIWIDLQAGRSRLWQQLDKGWRYGVGRAERCGVQVAQTDAPARVEGFYRLCQAISQDKGFLLPSSAPLMQALIHRGGSGPVQARLFLATYEGRLGAGAFILRCGSSIHYLWGGTDRELSKYRVGEAVQWRVIEWALEEGIRLYDLEGVDPDNNPGTYAFKKKMGGRELALVPRSFCPLSVRGRLLGTISPSISGFRSILSTIVRKARFFH